MSVQKSGESVSVQSHGEIRDKTLLQVAITETFDFLNAGQPGEAIAHLAQYADLAAPSDCVSKRRQCTAGHRVKDDVGAFAACDFLDTGRNVLLTEDFNALPREENGDIWLVVTTVVTDPPFLNGRFITSSHFKKLPDGTAWHPTPCRSS